MALITHKNAIRAGVDLPNMKTFGNNYGSAPGDGSPLPNLSDGCYYKEAQVGSAHPGETDPKKQRGVRRLVFEVVISSKEIRETYFTDDHYTKGSFVRLV